MFLAIRRRTILWCALCVIALLCVWSLWAPGRPEAEVTCPDGHPVVLDPGHGGIDGGAGAGGMLEKDVVLDIALRAQRHLELRGVPVLMTRTTDVDLGGPNDRQRHKRDLRYRARLANECRAAFLLSLHINSSRNPSESGMLVFYQWGSAPSRDAGVMLDHVMKLWKLHDRREPAYANRVFYMLRATRAPAVLIEMGFVTSATDRQRLSDAQYRERLGQAIAHVCQSLFQNWVKTGNW